MVSQIFMKPFKTAFLRPVNLTNLLFTQSIPQNTNTLRSGDHNWICILDKIRKGHWAWDITWYIPHCIAIFKPLKAAKMAASALEESEVATTLSVTLNISKEVVAQIASSSEDAATVLRKVKEVFDKRASNDEKYRADMANLRRARVNAGLCFLQ